MPEQPPPDDQPTSPDVTAGEPRPEEQTVPIAAQPDGTQTAGYAAPSVPVATPSSARTYQASRGVIAGAAAAVLLVGGLAGYALGATVVANDSPDRHGPGESGQFQRRFDGPGQMPSGPQGGYGNGPQGGFGGPQGGFGGPWSGPQDDGGGNDGGQQDDGSTPDDGSSSGDSGSGT